jgi:hypothetical protein
MRMIWFVQSIGMSLRDVVATLVRQKQRRFLLILPVLLLIGLLLAIASSSGVLAPFLYPLF